MRTAASCRCVVGRASSISGLFRRELYDGDVAIPTRSDARHHDVARHSDFRPSILLKEQALSVGCTVLHPMPGPAWVTPCRAAGTLARPCRTAVLLWCSIQASHSRFTT